MGLPLECYANLRSDVPSEDQEASGSPSPHSETFEKCSILFKVKKGENFDHRRHAVSALGVNTFSISRIKI